MHQSRTRYLGWDVDTDARAVADVAQKPGAAVLDRGAIGTRPCDLDPRIRKRPAQAPPLLLVSAAGPGGDGLSRDRTNKGDDGWVVAPARLPQQAGDRVHTARRDARPRARRARSGELTVVDVPHVAAAALRARTRARAETRSALQDATCRLHACGLRHDRRDTGRATGRPAPLRWRADVVCPTPAPPSVLPA